MPNEVFQAQVKQKELQIEEVQALLAKIAVKQAEDHSELLDPVISQLNRFITISREKIAQLTLEYQEMNSVYTY